MLLCLPHYLQGTLQNTLHGRGADGSVDLAIRVKPHGNKILISIADRGPGMPSGYRIDTGQGVGLRNVDARLQKTYGPAYRLQVGANEPQGTVVMIKIPTR